MGGAYTAAPAATVPSTSPPGWTGGWPFPGPLPPGYTPVYSLIGTAPATMAPGYPVTGVKFILADRDTYATGEPIGDIVYTAEIEGVTRKLRFSGEGALSNSVTGEYVYVAEDEKYGSEPEFDFDVTADDDGKILTLTALTIPWDDEDEFSSAKEIEIEIEVLSEVMTKVVYTLDISNVVGWAGDAMSAFMVIQGRTGESEDISNYDAPYATPYCEAGADWIMEGAAIAYYEALDSAPAVGAEDSPWTLASGPNNPTYPTNVSATLTAFEDDYTYSLHTSINAFLQCTLTWTAKFYSGDEVGGYTLQSTETKSTDYGEGEWGDGGWDFYGEEAWLFFHVAGQTITEV